jgi:hypothetical protein
MTNKKIVQEVNKLIKLTTLHPSPYPGRIESVKQSVNYDDILKTIQSIGYIDKRFSTFIEHLMFGKVKLNKYIDEKGDFFERFFFPKNADEELSIIDEEFVLFKSNICDIYTHFKKAVDAIKEHECYSKLGIRDKNFLKKFSETRNKIIEHNLDPRDFPNIIIMPIWDTAIGSEDFIQISILIKDSTSSNERRKCGLHSKGDFLRAESIFYKLLLRIEKNK